MKITHIALCGPVTDGLTYQDNLLPKYHKKLGYEISMITSQFIWGRDGKIVLDTRNNYKNENNIRTIRLEVRGKSKFNNRLKRYHDLYHSIEREKPDILFIHGVQFLDLIEIVKYLKKNPNIKVFVDNHADFSNSATNFLSKNILHRGIWKKLAHLIEPYTIKFFGVLPARVNFLRNIYKLPEDKLELLLMGADDELVETSTKTETKISIRSSHNIDKDDFLIVTGGKIDKAKKQTLSLMKAIRSINNKKIRLIVFGSLAPELKDEATSLIDGNLVQYIGWIDSDKSYDYFAASDLVVFPGRHSVFWEQVVALGIPLMVKWWEGTDHIDIGGNCKFLYKDSVDELIEDIEMVFNNKEQYYKMKESAMNNKKNMFLYSQIAIKSLEDKNGAK